MTDQDHNYHGAVIDVEGDNLFVTLYYTDERGEYRAHHTDREITDADVIVALALVEARRPGILNAALAAVRGADTHN